MGALTLAPKFRRAPNRASSSIQAFCLDWHPIREEAQVLPRPFGLVLQDWAPFADTPNKLGRQQLKRIVARRHVEVHASPPFAESAG
jgi:hypothetical protein